MDTNQAQMDSRLSRVERQLNGQVLGNDPSTNIKFPDIVSQFNTLNAQVALLQAQVLALQTGKADHGVYGIIGGGGGNVLI